MLGWTNRGCVVHKGCMGLLGALRDVLQGRAAGPLVEVPDGATFRRAVGLQLRLRPCEGLHRVEVTANRHGGQTRTSLPLAEAAALMSLTHWSTPAECGLSLTSLRRLVTDNLVFFSPDRPTQTLDAPVDAPTGNLALRRNVWPTPVVLLERELQPFPFMPRVGTLDDATLTGMHFGVQEMDTQVCSVGFSCCEAHALELRDLVAGLDGRTAPEASPLLDAMDALGLLERFAPPVIEPGASQVTWLGHAAVLVETAGQRILVDPLFHPHSRPARPSAVTPPDARSLGPLDAVLITHADNDHLNPQALCRIPRQTPLFLPRPRQRLPYHVDMARMLELLGFTRVAWMTPWERVTLGEVTVVAVPFEGEDWGLQLPTLTWLVHSTPLTVYLGADANPMPAVHAKLASEFKIDLAMLGVSGCQEAHVMPPGFGYGNFYSQWIAPPRRNEWVALCSGPEESAASARTLKARHAFGYAAGGASFIALAYTDRGTHAQLAGLLGSSTDGPAPLNLPLGVPVQIP